MGTISIIARRLEDGHVQYGWSGNGGYFRNVGLKLLYWYDNPETVEYLFGLGELSMLGAPGSERGGYNLFETNQCTGTPHTLGTSEREIFSKIAFVFCGYFYDLDNRWYYVAQNPFRLKLPLELLENQLKDKEYEVEYITEIERKLLEYIFGDYLNGDNELQEIFKKSNYVADDILKELISKQWPMRELFEKYRNIYTYFDDWVICETNDECTEVSGFKICKKGEMHIETINQYTQEELEKARSANERYRLEGENAILEREIAEKKKRNAELKKEKAEMEAEIARLKAELAAKS